VLHELAHVRRCDSLSSLLGFLCCSVFWFNPLVWLCARKLRFEAEAAADDLVLSAGVRASDYAAVLLSSISVSFGGRTQSLPAVCRMEKLGIEKRICALLDVSVNRAVVTQGWIVRAILVGLCSRSAYACFDRSSLQRNPDWQGPFSPHQQRQVILAAIPPAQDRRVHSQESGETSGPGAPIWRH